MRLRTAVLMAVVILSPVSALNRRANRSVSGSLMLSQPAGKKTIFFLPLGFGEPHVNLGRAGVFVTRRSR